MQTRNLNIRNIFQVIASHIVTVRSFLPNTKTIPHGVITVAWNIQEDGGLRNASMLISMDRIKNRLKSHGLVYCGMNSEMKTVH